MGFKAPAGGGLSSEDQTKLDNIEALADVTDETNVKASLDGATITTATVATGDKVLIQDADDADNLKTVTAQSIADLAGGGGASDFARAYLSTQMSSVDNTQTKVTLNAESFDSGNNFDPTTNNDYTVPSDGYYAVQAKLTAQNMTNIIELQIFNDSTEVMSTTGSSGQQELLLSDIIYAESGDAITMQVLSGDGNWDILNGEGVTYMNIYKLA